MNTKKIKPIIFIHTAAISNVEKCELEQNNAFNTNPPADAKGKFTLEETE